MPTRTKNEPARKGRTRVKNLPKNKKELTSQQAKKIKGAAIGRIEPRFPKIT